MLSLALALVAALHQGLVTSPGSSTPASGDTIGYWHQRIAYTIVATLDERAQAVHARGVLRYVNNSPDTLREMYFHQYLNAFRPASKWSAVDEREGRERFQHLQEPEYGYERFTAPVRIDGNAVAVDYPGAPDSTVARVRLLRALAPGDSLRVELQWDARPATVPRRQGRRGRHWDLAQWYPKVAVYDRDGWEFNALQPAGEFYGEYGTYDVTLVLPRDQIVAATGVPVSGDPGWARAMRAGSVHLASRAYDDLPAPPTADLPAGTRAVRFFARDVHHFAWSTSPDYRYEGGTYVRQLPGVHWPTWDTVAIHALYRAGDDTTWGGLRAVQRTVLALQWLEAIYGPYAYPQMTVLHRLDGGGTEFPMMQMNGSASQGLILHEGGHVFTYGILGNNEWRSGWMDEGLTSYQTEWAQGQMPQERARARTIDRFAPAAGYRALGARMALSYFDASTLDQFETDLRGRAQPIGTTAQDFRDFATYNDMIYNRAEVMYGQLRDVLGDSAFVAFLRDYYARWALKHVDERAMRASAERVSGRDLGWFFRQWVHHTGVMDYALERVRRRHDADGTWTTEATVVRRGQYRHAMSVGVRTRRGWMLRQVDPGDLDHAVVRITTPDEPGDVRLDPLHFSWDWDRRNDVAAGNPLAFRGVRFGIDWPFLAQADRDRTLALVRPAAWYSDPGGATLGVQLRSSYLDLVDRMDVGLATPLRRSVALESYERVQGWLRADNPYLGRRPLMGVGGGFAFLDDVFASDMHWRGSRDVRRGTLAHDLALTILRVENRGFVPELWVPGTAGDLFARLRWTRRFPGSSYAFAEPRVVLGRAEATSGSYAKAELAVAGVKAFGPANRLAARVYGAVVSSAVPPQRQLYLSASDPVTTFANSWWRPAGAILKRPGVNWLPLGGAALRGYHWAVAGSENTIGGNVDLSRRMMASNRESDDLAVFLHGFVDGAQGPSDRFLTDAGVGLSVRGRLYDRQIHVRIDSPFFVSDPALALDQGRAGAGEVAPRWTISFTDIW